MSYRYVEKCILCLEGNGIHNFFTWSSRWRMLKFCFCCWTVCWTVIQLDEIIQLLLDESPVLLQGGSTSHINHGDLFYATFKPLILRHFIPLCSDLVKRLTSGVNLVKSRINIVSAIIVGVLDCVGRDDSLQHK